MSLSVVYHKIGTALSPLIRSRLVTSLCSPPRSFSASSLIYPAATYGRVDHERPKVDVQPGFFDPKYNGIYTRNGSLLTCSALIRGKARKYFNAPAEIDVGPNSNPLQACIYGGILFGTHYGHFLTETMSRLWPLLESSFNNQWSDVPIVFRLAGQKQYPLERVAPFVKSIFNVLGIWDRILIPSQQIFVEDIVVPHVSISNNYKTYKTYVEMMQAVGNRLLDGSIEGKSLNSRKIYLSRSKLPQYMRHLANELQLENILQQHGYTVVHPQNMNLSEQIKMFREADEVVGPLGSAFHTLPLAGNSKLKVKYLVHYEPDVASTLNNVDAALEIDSTAIYCAFNHPLSLKKDSCKDQIIDLDRAVKGIFQAC